MRPIGIGLGIGFSAGAAAGVTPVASWDASTSTLAQLTALIGASRPSLATMFDSTGKLTYAPNNLVLNSATLSTQTVAVQAGVNYVLSIKGTGSVTNSGANASTLNGTGASNRVNLAFTASTASLMLTVTGSVTAARLSAVTYETTLRSQDDVDTTAAAYYGPRFDYSYNGAAWVPAGLLREGAGTNAQSPSIPDQSNWAVSATTLTTYSLASPDGATTATLVNEGATNASHFFYKAVPSLTSAGDVAQSIFVAAGTGRYLTLSNYSVTGLQGGYAVFDLTTGAVTQSGNLSTGTLTRAYAVQYGSFWRLVVVASAAADATGRQFVVSTANAGAYSGDVVGRQTYTGTSKTYYVWGTQAEAASYATTYTPTGASAVTRAADALTAASLTTYPAIIQKRDLATGVRSRVVINPWSGVSSEVDEWIEAIRIYPPGTSGTYLNTKLTVDGPW